MLDKIAAKESIASTEVSGALTDMNNAVRGLAERAATAEEKAELRALYAAAEATENKNYTDESWNTFSDALAAAKAALESETVTNSRVAEVMEALDNAVKGLTAKPASEKDKQELKSLYDSVKATVNQNYTTESWNAYQAALKTVENILAKGDAATQQEVQLAFAELKKTYAALQNAIAFEKTAYTVDATASVETKVNAGTAAVTYKSSDTSVATVDAKGVVTGIKKGKAVITAEAAGISATTTVTVTVPKITLTATSTKLQVKKSTKAIKVASKIATDSVVSWTSSNKKVAIVTKSGKVKAKKTGKTTLTVTMKSGATATCKLKVQKGKAVTKSVKVSSTKVTLNAGEKYEIGAVRNPITATEKITYKVNKKKVASVSKKGVITAKAKGTCKVTVKCNGKKKVVTVTVK